MDRIKAWIALVALIYTGLAASDINPVSGNWHVVMVIAGIVIGAFSTYQVANRPSVNAVS